MARPPQSTLSDIIEVVEDARKKDNAKGRNLGVRGSLDGVPQLLYAGVHLRGTTSGAVFAHPGRCWSQHALQDHYDYELVVTLLSSRRLESQPIICHNFKENSMRSRTCAKPCCAGRQKASDPPINIKSRNTCSAQG